MGGEDGVVSAKSLLITSENDVREMVRKGSGGLARWVEPAMGSTNGLPDCWLPVEREGVTETVHLELKCGKLGGRELTFHVRPEQKRELRAMARDGVKAGFLVGVEASNMAIFLPVDDDSLAGKVAVSGGNLVLYRPVDGKRFWQLVNSFFFSV